MLIDTHCHLEGYDNIDEIINKFNGIIIASGYNDETNKYVLELINKYDKVYGTIGIHPEEVENRYDLNIIIENAHNPKIVGIGEIGLDYHYTKENIEKQHSLFKRQLDIATKFNLPVVVHSRDAILDTYNILKDYNLSGSIHCFSSSKEMAVKFIDLGYKIGIGGVVTFKNSKKLQDVVLNIALDNILLETDSPFLSPEPFRGKVNEPKNVYYVAQKIAELKNVEIDEVLKINKQNACNVFKIM